MDRCKRVIGNKFPFLLLQLLCSEKLLNSQLASQFIGFFPTSFRHDVIHVSLRSSTCLCALNRFF